VKRNMCNW